MLHVVDDLHIHKVLVADDVRANFKGLLSNFVASPLAARRPVESGVAMLGIIFVLVTSAIRLITVIPTCILGQPLFRNTSV